MGNFRGSSWRTKHKTILKTNEGAIQTEHEQIVYEYNEICGQINVDVLAYIKQDACRGVHSACRREVNRHKLDICVLRLRQGRSRHFRM